ncbi:hypothetical protein NP493_246g03057 [Ridgeia piscesae]|uniref:Uncharacterized protein n=1 Tax=Ridgeia piscesae TaxID=27915 RepID=A0AAD9NZ75_RIDPI|nr:hypothetical protein NP493_246g03057 [Ridgeia piscesae]
MKAVLWVDTVQSLIMVAGLLSVMIGGIWKVGGIREVWRIADEGGRINVWNFDPNPLARSTVWTYLIGGFFRVFNSYISTQVHVQRYKTVHTAKEAQLAVYWNMPMYLGMTTLFAITGLVLFATYHKCDPFLAGRITKRDQMMPLLVVETLGHLPGFSGLFMACLCSAAISSTSSCQNSLAATFLSDIARPIYRRCTGRHLGTKRSTRVAELTAAAVGIVNVLMAFVIIQWKGTLFHLTIQITGMMSSPLAGMFVVGMLFPFCKTKSALGGLFTAFGVTLWLGVGSMLQTTRAPSVLATTADGCPVNATTNSNYTVWDSTTSAPVERGNTTTRLSTCSFHMTDLYRMSPMMYAAVGASLSVIVAVFLGGMSSAYYRGKRVYQQKNQNYVQYFFFSSS